MHENLAVSYDHVDEVISKEELKSAFEVLRPEEREVIYLNYYEGYSASKIAKINNMPRSTVLSLMQRGKRKLARALRSLALVEKKKY